MVDVASHAPAPTSTAYPPAGLCHPPNFNLMSDCVLSFALTYPNNMLDTQYENFVRQESEPASLYWVFTNTLLLLQFDLQQRELRSAMQDRIQVRHLPEAVHQGIKPEKCI